MNYTIKIVHGTRETDRRANVYNHRWLKNTVADEEWG